MFGVQSPPLKKMRMADDEYKSNQPNQDTRYLDRCRNILKNKLVEAIQNPALVKINLAQLNITDVEIINYIIPFLRSNPNITKLDLSDNNIGDKGARALVNNSTITKLNLNHNMIICDTNCTLKELVEQNRKKQCKEAFLLGTHPSIGANSSVRKFFVNAMADRHLLKEILSFSAPPELELAPPEDLL